jgi:hypothetical protein
VSCVLLNLSGRSSSYFPANRTSVFSKLTLDVTMRQSTHALDSTGLSALTQYSPRINHSSPILASIIELPPSPLICCSVFTASHSATSSGQLAAIENARRQIVFDYDSVSVGESLLVSVHILKDNVSLYVFALGSTTEATVSQLALASMQFPDLDGECFHRIRRLDSMLYILPTDIPCAF